VVSLLYMWFRYATNKWRDLNVNQKITRQAQHVGVSPRMKDASWSGMCGPELYESQWCVAVFIISACGKSRSSPEVAVVNNNVT
jgi:hypothetical protein